MGLINEIYDVKATLNQREKNKQERENKRALIEQYNQDIKKSLQKLFYDKFNFYNESVLAYEHLYINKDYYICEIQKEIESETIIKENKIYYKYKNKFTIDEDLNSLYYKILKNIYTEYKQKENIINDILLIKLENILHEIFTKSDSKYAAYINLQKSAFIDGIIEEITTETKEQDFLYNKYFIILSKVKKFYNGNIEQEKQETKDSKRLLIEKAKIKRRDRLITLTLINRLLK